MKRSPMRRTGAKTLKPKSAAAKRARTLRRKKLGKTKVARSAVKAVRVWKSREHLDRVKAQQCIVGARDIERIYAGFAPRASKCEGPTDPHHCRKLTGEKRLLPRHDSLTVPLCRAHHRQVDGDERLMWNIWGINPKSFIRSFSPEGAAALAALERQT